jgi:glucose-1-phosphate thymidylyltransferase
MLAGVKEILVITTPEDQASFQRLLGDGGQWGTSLQFAVQPSPDGLAQAFHIGAEFVGSDSAVLVLGDNIFFGHDLEVLLKNADQRTSGATVFAYPVREASAYGVVEFDGDGKAIGLVEKPKVPKSNFAVTGLYFYDNSVIDKARDLKPSARGELEITDLNRLYLEEGSLNVEVMGRGYAWLDTGSHESMLQASQFVESVEQRQGLMVCCPEEIAFRRGWISTEQLTEISKPLQKTNYGQYLLALAEKRIR